ncbi:MAG: ATP-binding protein [Algisphaera sp.]
MIGTFFLSFALGVATAVPAAAVWSRRTERRVRRLEQRTRSAERLAELGTLTGGLAHEIKNPLSTLGLNVQLIQEDLLDLERGVATTDPGAVAEQLGRTRRRVDGLLRETQRLRSILEDFLRFAGRVKLDRQPLDINALCVELSDFFQPQADELRVNLRLDLQAHPGNVWADGPLLKQALLNLMINACQAIAEAREANTPHGGGNELILRTANTSDRDSRSVLIHVTDTGPGLPSDTVDKIFQPYFSSKRGGTGLGLPTSRRIAEEHGGSLVVHTEQGRGSDFLLTLPRGSARESPADYPG